MAVVDAMLGLINEVATGHALKYNKFYIGLTRNGIVDNFVQVRARKDFCIAEFRIPRTDELNARLEESGVDRMEYHKKWNRYRLRLTSPTSSKTGTCCST
jgi:hypothetical protein